MSAVYKCFRFCFLFFIRDRDSLVDSIKQFVFQVSFLVPSSSKRNEIFKH